MIEVRYKQIPRQARKLKDIDRYKQIPHQVRKSN